MKTLFKIMLLQKIIKNLPKEKKKLKISGLSNNSKKIKKGYVFLQLEAKTLMEKNILKKQLKKVQ